MLTFLFWNINRKPLEQTVARLARGHSADLVILAECQIEIPSLLRALNPPGTGDYRFAGSQCEKLAVYTRFSSSFLEPRYETSRYSIRRLRLPARPEMLLVVAHLPSKLHQSSESQSFECVALAKRIREQEAAAGHERTLLIGDLNMNPFESGMVAANGLHGTMSREVAGRERRTVQGEDYPFFYNPMWSHFGDAHGGPPGTYYYQSAQHVCFFWNVFDQVLVRPGLLNCFRGEGLEILTHDGTSSLLSTRGTPDVSVASDHLPILLRLTL